MTGFILGNQVWVNWFLSLQQNQHSVTCVPNKSLFRSESATYTAPSNKYTAASDSNGCTTSPGYGLTVSFLNCPCLNFLHHCRVQQCAGIAQVGCVALGDFAQDTAHDLSGTRFG
jgi:hypothetical protein